MKILAVGRNFVKHIEELKNERPDEPVIFTKPDSSLLLRNRPFYYPSFSHDIHHEVEIVIKINRVGKHVESQFAHKYFDQIAIGIDFTARDLQQKAKDKGLPWDLAKGFDGSGPLSEFMPLTDFKDINNLDFSLKVDGQVRQSGNTGLMLFTFSDVIAYISRFITLKKGDLIFTGTPHGVGPVAIGNRLEAFIEDRKLLDFEVK